MKTSKNSTKKKDWQKADARVLGQILAAQNIDFVLPDSIHIAEFFAETLIAIPGIKACRICLYEASVQRGGMEVGICESCGALNKKTGSNEEVSLFEPGFKCRLASQPGIQFNAIVSSHHHFGFFIFQVNDLDTFNVYKPFIDNLANYVALSLENRLQRDLLQKAHNELELRVAERTEELRASNEAIKDLYNNAPCGYHSLDKDGFFTLINDTELRWLGYSRNEIVGKVAFRDLLTTDSLKAFEANFLGFKERGWVSDLEFEMVRKDGTILPVLLNATAITDSAGNYVMSRSTIFDITAHKRVEDALHQSEERFRRLAENARDVIYRMSIPDGIYEYVSPAVLSVFGYSPEECYKTPILIKQAIHPDWHKYFEEQWANLIKGEIPPTYEYQFIHKSGEVRWLNQRNILVRDNVGTPLAIEGIVTDITERKQAEEALRKSEQKFRSFVEESSEGFTLVDEQGAITEWNHAREKMTGLPASQVIGQKLWDVLHKILLPELQTPERYERNKRLILNALQTGKSPLFDNVLESEVVRQNGERQFIQQTIFPIKTDKGYRMGSVTRDVTERKQAEQSLRESEERFRSFVEKANDIVYTVSLDGVFTYISPNWKEILGHEISEVEGKSFETFVHPDDLAACRAILNRTITSGEKQSGFEYRVKHKNGSWQWHTSNASVLRDGEGRIVSFLGIARNITERKLNERELIILNRAINRSSDAIFLINEQLIFVYVNDIACRSLGYTREELLTMGPSDIDAVITYDAAKDIMSKQFANGHYPTFETQHKTRDGRIFPVEISSSVVEYDGVKFSLTTVRDITERKQAAENLHLQSMALEAAANGITISDHEGIIIWANSAFTQLTGYSIEELIGENPRIFKSGKQDSAFYKNLWDTILSGNIWHGELINRRKDGKLYAEEMTIAPVYRNHEEISHFIAIKQDVTERKQHEREHEVIITVSTALRQAKTRSQILNVILDQSVELFEAEGATLVLPDPQTGGFIDEMGRGVVGERMTGLNIPPGKGVCNWVLTNKQPYLSNHANHDPLFYRPELLGDSHCVAFVPLIVQEQVIGVLWIARQVDLLEQDLRLLNAIADIAANAIRRVLLHEQTELQLHHLIALHQIDVAISSNFDSNITLNVILTNVKNELEVDAVSILLLNPVTLTLDYAAGIGFKTRSIEQSQVKLEDEIAGRAVREYRTVSRPDLKLVRETFSRSSLLADEEFEAHYATPLVVKGQVKGVLELFHRKTFEPEAEWLDYFETLATQAAIAIESASLLESLQRSNAELMLAYDGTIEGWSRALDLRDRETEGHTQRVTEMALKLAEKMGMSDAEKIDLRRGSLLHDIGKMGVPDSILLKPGDLTDSEWEVMRRHPMYAYQMLSPISYLKHALEVSYCHHEKWDGSGYPRGLKGDEIPLSARVFAIVDVYDALTSDRPYRKAWTHEEVYRYIQEQAGKHFDPQVVRIFLESRLY